MQRSILTTASRTTTVTGDDIFMGEAKSCHLITDVTTAGTGSVTPKIQGKDANGIYYDLLVGTALTSIGTNVLKIGLGMTGSANAVATDFVPDTIRIVHTHNNANAMTYTSALNTKA